MNPTAWVQIQFISSIPLLYQHLALLVFYGPERRPPYTKTSDLPRYARYLGLFSLAECGSTTWHASRLYIPMPVMLIILKNDQMILEY